jgi:hypothetical protein
MEMKLFEIAGERYTRIKVSLSQYRFVKNILAKHGITEPSKKSSRYIYFEVKGDLLNVNKEQPS